MGINGILQTKNRSGIIETPVWQAPSDLSGRFILRAIMPQDDLEDTDNGVILKIYISLDEENWRYKGGFAWIGGNPYAIDAQTILSGIGVSIIGSEIANKYIKVEIQINKPQKLGFELEYVE